MQNHCVTVLLSAGHGDSAKFSDLEFRSVGFARVNMMIGCVGPIRVVVRRWAGYAAGRKRSAKTASAIHSLPTTALIFVALPDCVQFGP